MKNAVSEVWLLGLVILFIMSFAGFLAVTVSYSRAFKMKDMVLTKIENYKGVTNKAPEHDSNGYYNPGTLQSINAYLIGSGYKVTGKCPNKSDGSAASWIGITDLNISDTVGVDKTPKGKKVYYCISKYYSYYKGSSSSTNIKSYTYKVRLFFKLELPVLGDIFTFDVDGETNKVTDGIDDSNLLTIN